MVQDPSLMPVATTVMHKDGILTGDSFACGKVFTSTLLKKKTAKFLLTFCLLSEIVEIYCLKRLNNNLQTKDRFC